MSAQRYADRLGRTDNRAVNGPAGSGTMSENGHDRFEIPKEMRSMAEASFDQARKAFEKFLTGAQATAGSLEERGATVRAGARCACPARALRPTSSWVSTRARVFSETIRLISRWAAAPPTATFIMRRARST